MSLPDLEYIKASIHIDAEDDDIVLLELRDSAAAYFLSIGVIFDPDNCPKPIAQAMVLYVKHFFDYAASFSAEEVNSAKLSLPLAVTQLLAPYREVSL